MKKLLLSTAALIGFTAGAFAADLPARTMAPAPSPVPFVAPPMFTWTGFYAGVHAGGHWQDQRARRGTFTEFSAADFDNRAITSAGLEAVAGLLGFPVPPGFFTGYGSPPGTLGAIFPSTAGERNRAGWMGGAQVGYNQQFGMFVVGGELDISYLGSGRSTTSRVQNINLGTGILGPAALGTDLRLRHGMNWLGTARLRAGVGFDRFLVYGTGGLAFGNPDHRIDFTARLTAPGVGLDQSITFSGRNDDWKAGWTAGAGAEYAIANNLTIKAEWLYYDLGRTTVAATSPDAPGFQGAYHFENRGHIGRVGLNWKW
jgi:outer membrane immunogenic protein